MGVRVVNDHVAAIKSTYGVLRERRQSPANALGYTVHFLFEARRQVAVAYELLLQTGRQPFVSVPTPVSVLIAVVLAIIATVLTAILPVMVAAIFIPVLG